MEKNTLAIPSITDIAESMGNLIEKEGFLVFEYHNKKLNNSNKFTKKNLFYKEIG